MTDEHARESSPQPTRETATGGASHAVLEYGWASPHFSDPGSPDGLLPWELKVIERRVSGACTWFGGGRELGEF